MGGMSAQSVPVMSGRESLRCYGRFLPRSVILADQRGVGGCMSAPLGFSTADLLR